MSNPGVEARQKGLESRGYDFDVWYNSFEVLRGHLK